MICIGYVGIECFDFVLYTGRTLTKLNKRVLVVDFSETGAFLRSIPHGMGLDSENGIVNYRDINYTRHLPTKEEIAMFKDGVVFVVYGLNYINDISFPFQEINIVINTFPNVIYQVNSLMQNNLNSLNVRVLIRDMISPDDVDNVKQLLSFEYDEEKINYLYLDLSDYENAVNCQYKQVVSFTYASRKMEKCIINQINRILPDVSHNQITKALSAAKKGR